MIDEAIRLLDEAFEFFDKRGDIEAQRMMDTLALSLVNLIQAHIISRHRRLIHHGRAAGLALPTQLLSAAFVRRQGASVGSERETASAETSARPDQDALPGRDACLEQLDRMVRRGALSP